MKHKVAEYLFSKEKELYTHLDLIFESYINGEIEKELHKFEFYDLEIFTEIKTFNNSFQIYFKYYNLVCTIDFSDVQYEYSIYTAGASVEEFENSIVKCDYENDFSIQKLLHLIFMEANKHTRLKNNTNDRRLQKNIN